MGKKENRQNCDVFISGGGVPGLTLALLLGDLGLDVIVVDPHPPTPPEHIAPDGRTAALMMSSVNILKGASVWDDCLPHGAALKTLRIVEGKTRVDFQAADIGHPYFGVNMPNGITRAIIAGHVTHHAAITFLTPAAMQCYNADDTGMTITLDDGTDIRARLLVGADGRHSITRSMAGIEMWERDYQQSAISALITHSKNHDFVSTEFHRPGGPFTLVPLPGKMSSVVWVEYNDDCKKFMALRRPDFEKELQDRTENLLGTITLSGTPASWPLKAMRAKSLTAPRLALLAEAAHILHPLGAQGLNLSLRDVATLAEEIADAARCGLDIGNRAVLDRYESRRRADVFTRSIGTDSMNRMVSNDLSVLSMLRNVGLRTIDSIPQLRRFAMHEGIMPGYDDSRLSRGEKL